MNGQDHYYKNHIFCCGNERPAGNPRGCCKEKGSDDLRNFLRARLKEEGITNTRVNAAGCLDRCELGATIVIYPEGTWYTYATKDDVNEIVESHFKQGKKVERLLLTKDQKELTPEQKASRPAPASAATA